jgi:transcriptional regulator with XRE-family HTH domain
MIGMNEAVRSAVKTAMKQKGLSQGQLARDLGLERPAVTRLLSGTSGKVPDTWQKVLDALGLEIVVQEKIISPHHADVTNTEAF